MSYTDIRITRVATDPKQGTFGVLTINGVPFCVTLEPSDMDNKSNISCIPASRYNVERYHSKKYSHTWEVQSVPDRSYILFHAGNVADHTRGCIILAQHFGKLNGHWAVLNSGTTFKKFMNLTKDTNELALTISEAY